MIAASTLLGLDNQPGLLRGYGTIPAGLARQIAEHADNPLLRRLFCDPIDGRLLGMDTATRCYTGTPRQFIYWARPDMPPDRSRHQTRRPPHPPHRPRTHQPRQRTRTRQEPPHHPRPPRHHRDHHHPRPRPTHTPRPAAGPARRSRPPARRSRPPARRRRPARPAHPRDQRPRPSLQLANRRRPTPTASPPADPMPRPRHRPQPRRGPAPHLRARAPDIDWTMRTGHTYRRPPPPALGHGSRPVHRVPSTTRRRQPEAHDDGDDA